MRRTGAGGPSILLTVRTRHTAGCIVSVPWCAPVSGGLSLPLLEPAGPASHAQGEL